MKLLDEVQAAGKIVSVEIIQDEVERALMESRFYKTAKAYIVYREQRMRLRQAAAVAVEVESTIDEYLQRADWRVNANANQGYSLGGMILNASGKLIANYWLHHIYTQEVREAHLNGDPFKCASRTSCV